MFSRPVSFAVLGCAYILAAAALTSQTAATAHEYALKTLTIKHPMARPTPPVARNGAVFMSISDQGGSGDRLLAVSTPQAKRAELHETTISDNVARMMRKDYVDVPANGTVTFEPGGLHVMLMGLTSPLTEQMTFPMTLTFKNAGDITVDVKVEEYHSHSGGEATEHSGHH